MYSIKNIILVFAQSRSGHHAVIDWLFNQFNGHKLFFNYNNPKRLDPFFKERVQYYLNDKRYYRVISKSWIKDNLVKSKTKEFLLETSSNIEIINKSDKNLLILNYENINTKDIPIILKQVRKHFGDAKIHKVFVMRDLLNLLSSKIRSGREITIENLRNNDKKIKEIVDKWIKYNEYITNKNDCILISYNKWFCDKEYRSYILDIINTDHKDLSLPQLATFGGGSSFDGYDIDKKTNNMDVLNRWREYEHENNLINLCYNKDVDYYTKLIFGDNLYK